MVDRRPQARPRLRLLPADLDQGWMPFAWLVYLLFVPTEAIYRQQSPPQWAATVAGMIVFLGLYFRAYWVNGRQQLAIVAGMTLLGAVFAGSNDASTVYFVYAACNVPRIGPPGAAYRNVAIYAVISASICVALRLPAFSIGYTVVVGALLGAAIARNIERKCTDAVLRLAHEEVERMAKVAERERIARDLHDVLGHTLSVIVLKSELAAKLADRDVVRAAAEIREVEQIARETLSELRSAVAGYRSAGIDAEFARARSVLEVAGVSVACESARVPLTATQEGVLALAMREGVTNIIRHARARTCRLQLRQGAGHVRLEIADDGSGESGNEGFGLAGMRERVEALGGTLVREVADGTRLIVTLPA
jgi:two-component system sensor histidine kinase DesK